jgi:isoquinoline 1-oxidoreductase alpha subunit
MITLNVNGKDHRVDVAPDTPLLWVLRDYLGLTGVKYGCGIGECGSCTVLIDGKAERSCVTEVKGLKGKKIVTIEGLPETHPVKQAWIDKQVPQCGYCQPGMILQAVDVLTHQPQASRQKMAEAMDDVMCRCGTHHRVLEAMETAAAKMKGGRS